MMLSINFDMLLPQKNKFKIYYILYSNTIFIGFVQPEIVISLVFTVRSSN